MLGPSRWKIVYKQSPRKASWELSGSPLVTIISDVFSTTKSTVACPFMVVLGRYSMLYLLSSIAHFITFSNASGF